MSLAVLTPYYKEHATNEYLSKTFESNVVLTPSFTKRRTASQENYLRCRAQENDQFRTPWGRKNSYGGCAVMQLPNDLRPKGGPPLRMQKGSSHYGSGVVAEPRGIPVQNFYSTASLQRKSSSRDSDQLSQNPTKVNMSKHQIDLNYPQENPYASHISTYKSIITPTLVDPKEKTEEKPLLAETPAKASDLGIIDKARGGKYRHETLSIPLNSQKLPMTWPGAPSYFKILKHSNREQRAYYPVPTDQNNASIYYAKGTYPSTVKALTDLRLAQWQTTYQRDYDRTDKTWLNLDDEETLEKIAAGPNAQVVKSLMADATSSDGTKQTVEEITGEEARKNRMVQFEDMFDKYEVATDDDDDIGKSADKNRILPRSIMKSTRPLSATERSNKNIIKENQRLIKSALAGDSSKVATEQSWSKTDYARKFNTIYYNEDKTDLYDKLILKNSLPPLPQKDFVKTSKIIN